MAIAIDFGTSNTVITRINPVTGESEIVKLANLAQKNSSIPPIIPSLVYINNANNDDVIIGQKVRNKGLDSKNNQRFFSNFKRGIGTDIQGFLPILDDKQLDFEKLEIYF